MKKASPGQFSGSSWTGAGVGRRAFGATLDASKHLRLHDESDGFDQVSDHAEPIWVGVSLSGLQLVRLPRLDRGRTRCQVATPVRDSAVADTCGGHGSGLTAWSV
jgi:hypothetical protein